jgi:hypothetical protein
MNIPWENINNFGQQTMLDMDLFSISWILGRFCNYKCSYCWPYARSDNPDYYTLTQYFGIIDEIKRQARYNNFTKFHWSFSGGEPTAFKHFLKIVDHLQLDDTAQYQSIHMTTNLSPGAKWWSSWLTGTRALQRRSLTASFHAEFADEQEFADKCVNLMDHGIFVTVNQVMVPDRFYETFDRCERFRKQGINVTLKPQSNETATSIVDGYTDDMVKIMQDDFSQMVNDEKLFQIRLNNGTKDYYLDQAERFNSFGFNKFSDWTCNSGYQSVIIRGNQVKRGYSCHDPVLGTLDKFELFTRPQKCITQTCVSSADSKIPKWKIIPIKHV